ncbi:MAG: ribonuclease HII [Alphaproteobacteria bacterium]|jgi:ribonuclease HII|nr:ribonuclease HII [Alphaproteobacteria bacterium]
MPDYSMEKAARGPVCGVDEVGRGPLAGPVVAAAVILDPAHIPAGLDDSKKLKPARREALVKDLIAFADIGIGAASAREIERLNILGATMLAMRRAVLALPRTPACALVDGNRAPDLPCRVETVVKGDGRSLSIAAASIIAKVTRDRAMHALHHRYPAYGWDSNAGYPAPAHLSALKRHGPCPHHRRSFAPVRLAQN